MNLEIKQLHLDPMIQLIHLPLKEKEGRYAPWAAAEAFAVSIAELHKRYPDKRFQLIPFSFDTYNRSGIASLQELLAVAD